MIDFKQYSDLQPLYSKPEINKDNFITSSDPLDIIGTIWNQFVDDETVRRYQYEERKQGKKYEHRFGYSLEILIPGNLNHDEKVSVAQNFMNELLVGVKKVSWTCDYKTKGDGHYLKFYILIAKKYRKEFEVNEYYNSDVYRNKHTGGFINKDHEDAVIVARKGDVKKTFMTTWSKKIRLFEMSKSYFTNHFIPSLQTILLKVLKKVRKVRHINFLTGIKHVTLSDPKKSVYYNKNIRVYNAAVDEINLQLTRWEDAIYSPAHYYQESNLLEAWNRLKGKFKSSAKKKRIMVKSSSSKKVRLSLHPWIGCDTFAENVDTFKEIFYKDLEVFLNNHILIEKGI